MTKYIDEPKRKTEICHEADVIVVGGGPFGFPAAVAAARNGMKTILVEHYSSLGGVATTGLCHSFEGVVPQIDGGIFRELKTSLVSSGSLIEGYYAAFDPEIAVIVMAEMLQEAGVIPLFHSTGVDVVMEDSLVKGVIIESKSGRQAILGKIIIDATGDGDLAYRAGCQYEITELSDRQPCSLMFRMGGVDVDKLIKLGVKWGIRRGSLKDAHPNPFPNIIDVDHSLIENACRNGKLKVNLKVILIMCFNDRLTEKTGMATINATHYTEDGLDNFDLTKMEIRARKDNMAIASFLKENVPGMENSFISHSANTIGVRETRRIKGDYVLTIDDLLSAAKFEDTVVNYRFSVQGHGPGIERTFIELPNTDNIPFRTMLPKGIENILVGGRDISVDHKALMGVRYMPCCMALGQAAGTAAAISINDNVTVRNVDIRKLQETLIDQRAQLISI